MASKIYFINVKNHRLQTGDILVRGKIDKVILDTRKSQTFSVHKIHDFVALEIPPIQRFLSTTNSTTTINYRLVEYHCFDDHQNPHEGF